MNYTLQKLKGSFNLPMVISVAASSPDNVQTSADQQIVRSLSWKLSDLAGLP